MSNPTILVVEDEQDIRDLMRMQLELEGYEVLYAEDGLDGVRVAAERMPDLVLCDVMMPGCDGFEVVRRLRASQQTRNIPIILLTAKTTPDDRREGLSRGANDYITKPFDPRELRLRIHNLLEWSRAQRAANPLTGLPGNLSINAEIRRRLDEARPFALLQVDVDYFKAFNDHYGYARGDRAIQTLAQILVDAANEHGDASTFVGHIGGDDFVVITEPEHAERMGEAVIARFEEVMPALYDHEDYERGHIEVRNRRHQMERFPLMSLTIALVSTDRVPVTHLAQLIDIAQELKTHGKGIVGSVLVNERRRGETASDSDEKVA